MAPWQTLKTPPIHAGRGLSNSNTGRVTTLIASSAQRSQRQHTWYESAGRGWRNSLSTPQTHCQLTVWLAVGSMPPAQSRPRTLTDTTLPNT